MNFRMILKSLGSVLCIEAFCMFPALLVSMIYGQGDKGAFILAMILVLLVGVLLYQIKPTNSDIYARDGFAIVALGWILISFFGALPFVFSGVIPSLSDALFESISGFTTTGATILTEIESLPKGILFWRSFTHWMGGMGVLVLTLAVLPSVKANTVHIMKAESPGPTPEKLVPKIGQTVKILYAIYIVITALEFLCLMLGGLSVYDALIHAFGTAGTGGFSNKNASVAAFGNLKIEVIITVFMFLFGVNFTLYFQSIRGNFKSILKNEELRFYVGVVLTSILLITINIHGSVYQSIGEALRYSSFQVNSIITTTGFGTADFNVWPTFSKCILVFLMVIGASAGSTGGGVKCIRILLLIKIARREVAKIIHPRSVHTVKIGGKAVDEETLSGIMAFFFLYMFIFVSAVLFIALDGKDIITSVTAVIATISNIGPGLEMVGPTGNFAAFSVLGKGILSFCMIIGRLEIYPVLILLSPAFWKRVNI